MSNPGKQVYGKHTNGKIGVRTGDVVGIRTGKFCTIEDSLSSYIYFERDNITPVNNYNEWVSTYPFGRVKTDVFDAFSTSKVPIRTGMVIIGNDVFIGDGAKLKSGVTIGNGAVVSKFSNVVCDVQPYSIVYGLSLIHI